MRDQGFTLVPVLALSSLIAITAMLAHRHSAALLSILETRAHAEKAHLESMEAVAGALALPGSRINGTGRAGSTERERVLIRLALRLPFQFTEFFKDASICPTSEAGAICTSLPSSGTVYGSLSISSPLVLPEASPARLGATGEVALASVTLQSDTIITAGDSIRLGYLNARGFRITFISSRGGVSVARAAGTTLVSIRAANGAQLPFQPVDDNGLWPPGASYAYLALVPAYTLR